MGVSLNTEKLYFMGFFLFVFFKILKMKLCAN